MSVTLSEDEREALLALAYAYAYPANDDDPRAEWSNLEGYVRDLIAARVQQAKAERDEALADTQYGSRDWGLLHDGVRHVPFPALRAALDADG